MENIMDTRYIEVRLTKHSDRIGAIEAKVDRLAKQIEELKNACDRFEETINFVRDKRGAEKTLSEVG